MNDVSTAALGILIPFLGTILGASLVLFLVNGVKPIVQKIFLGFAAGVMIAASIWSLILPSIEMAKQQGIIPWVPAAVGFLLGIALLLVLDSVIPHLHLHDNEPEGIKASLKKSTMLMLAVTLHNIPEGMAIGVVFSGVLLGNTGMTMSGALVLAIGIALQNFPEGAIISLPLRSQGFGRVKSFTYGMLSGIVEPIAAVLTILLARLAVPVLPYLLSFAAGAMIYVVVEELIPESQAGSHSNISTIAVAIGFVIMMVLDIALG